MQSTNLLIQKTKIIVGKNYIDPQMSGDNRVTLLEHDGKSSFAKVRLHSIGTIYKARVEFLIPVLQQGGLVRLVTKPNGCSSQHYPLTVGRIYKCLGFDGSNIITTTDELDSTADYWHGHVVQA